MPFHQPLSAIRDSDQFTDIALLTLMNPICEPHVPTVDGPASEILPTALASGHPRSITNVLAAALDHAALVNVREKQAAILVDISRIYQSLDSKLYSQIGDQVTDLAEEMIAETPVDIASHAVLTRALPLLTTAGASHRQLSSLRN